MQHRRDLGIARAELDRGVDAQAPARAILRSALLDDACAKTACERARRSRAGQRGLNRASPPRDSVKRRHEELTLVAIGGVKARLLHAGRGGDIGKRRGFETALPERSIAAPRATSGSNSLGLPMCLPSGCRPTLCQSGNHASILSLPDQGVKKSRAPVPAPAADESDTNLRASP